VESKNRKSLVLSLSRVLSCLVILLIGIVFHVFNFTFVPPSLMIILVNSRIRLVNKRIVIRVEHRLGSIICTHFLSPSEDNPLQPLSWVGLAGHGLTDYTTKYLR
jgi:hypothetical protein